MEIRIQGLAELVAAFAKAKVQLPAEFHRAMVASTIAVKQEAQARVPVRTSALKTSIMEQVDYNPLIGRVIVQQPYGKYVEFGTGLHAEGGGQRIQPTRAQALVFMVNGQKVFVKSIAGMKPKPFLRPAFRDNMTKITDYFRQATDQVLKQLAGK